jgi:hypothetical protein
MSEWSGGTNCGNVVDFVRRSATGGLNQPSKRPDESVEHRRAAETSQLERQRNRAADIRLELHVVKRGRKAFDPRNRGTSKRNTRLVASHQDSFYPQGTANDPQLSEREHRLCLGRERAEPIA